MSGNKLLERMNITLKTGEWWAIPWWREAKYYENCLFTKNQTGNAFDELIKIFDSKWIIEQRDAVITETKEFFKKHAQKVGNNPHLLYYKQKLDSLSEPSEAFKICQLAGFQASHHLFNVFFTDGLSPFQFLCSLGLNLHIVREKRLVEDLEKRLKNAKGYLGAEFELNFLAHFLRNDFDIIKNHRSGKGNHNCEFKISKRKETIFIEVKRPEQFCERNNERIIKGFNRLISNLLKDESEEMSAVGEPLLSEVEINKVSNIIEKAARLQLPDEGPGVVIVALPLVFDAKRFEDIANVRFWSSLEFCHLSAIVLVEIYFVESEFRHTISVILNPKAKIDVSSYSAIKAILSLDNSREVD